jgi:hypothetical protein
MNSQVSVTTNAIMAFYDSLDRKNCLTAPDTHCIGGLVLNCFPGADAASSKPEPLSTKTSQSPGCLRRITTFCGSFGSSRGSDEKIFASDFRGRAISGNMNYTLCAVINSRGNGSSRQLTRIIFLVPLYFLTRPRIPINSS